MRESLRESDSHVQGFKKGLEQNSLRRSAYKEWFSNAREWFTGRLAGCRSCKAEGRIIDMND
jgi:hypothetical protein